MATRDFTANQIRTAKVIMTGSAAQGGIGHKNLELSVYSESVAPNELGGTPSPSPYSQVGDDASIFISGSQTARGGSDGGLTLFHGDTYISGTLVVENAGRTSHGGSISGSIHHTATGDSYLKAGTGISISSGSANGGQVTITSTAAQNLFQTIAVSGQNDVVADSSTDTLTLVAGTHMTITTDAAADSITFTANNRVIKVDPDGTGYTPSVDPVLGATDELILTAGTNITLAENGGIVTINSTAADTNTTYSISCVDGDNTDEEKIRLTDSDGGTDDIVLEAGTGLSISRSSDKITFTNTVLNTDTDTTYDLLADTVSGNARIKLNGSDSTSDAVALVAGSNVTITQASNNITIDSTGGGVTVEESGTVIGTGAASTLNFTGTGVTVTDAGSGQRNIIVSDDNTFRTVKVDPDGTGSSVVSIGATENLTLKAGTNVTLAESAGTVTINSSGGGGDDGVTYLYTQKDGPNLYCSDLAVAANTYWADKNRSQNLSGPAPISIGGAQWLAQQVKFAPSHAGVEKNPTYDLHYVAINIPIAKGFDVNSLIQFEFKVSFQSAVTSGTNDKIEWRLAGRQARDVNKAKAESIDAATQGAWRESVTSTGSKNHSPNGWNYFGNSTGPHGQASSAGTVSAATMHTMKSSEFRIGDIINTADNTANTVEDGIISVIFVRNRNDFASTNEIGDTTTDDYGDNVFLHAIKVNIFNSGG